MTTYCIKSNTREPIVHFVKSLNLRERLSSPECNNRDYLRRPMSVPTASSIQFKNIIGAERQSWLKDSEVRSFSVPETFSETPTHDLNHNAEENTKKQNGYSIFIPYVPIVSSDEESDSSDEAVGTTPTGRTKNETIAMQRSHLPNIHNSTNDSKIDVEMNRSPEEKEYAIYQETVTLLENKLEKMLLNRKDKPLPLPDPEHHTPKTSSHSQSKTDSIESDKLIAISSIQLHRNNKESNVFRKRSTNTQLKSEKQVSNLNHRDEKKKKLLASSKNMYLNEKHETPHSVEKISKSSKNNVITKSIPNIVKTTSNQNWKNWKNTRSTSAPI